MKESHIKEGKEYEVDEERKNRSHEYNLQRVAAIWTSESK